MMHSLLVKCDCNSEMRQFIDNLLAVLQTFTLVRPTLAIFVAWAWQGQGQSQGKHQDEQEKSHFVDFFLSFPYSAFTNELTRLE